MNTLAPLYRHSLSLLTDLYQITMAYGYWKSGLQDREAVFHLFFRKNPFQGGFAVAAGLGPVVEFLESLRFTDDDVAYLATLTGQGGRPLFEPAFLDYLRDLQFDGDVDAVPEGTAVFPMEPILRVRGRLPICQLIETPLLTLINFSTLIATKSARICLAAKGDPVIEFGLRRAQGIDGALTASRAAYLGGCAATSNVLAGKLYGIPVKGTHAHSWVMSFPSERESFEAYARAMPHNCVFLVDTYNTLDGVRNAIDVARDLRRDGHELTGIRLDSGDLAWLSREARRLLDDAGFPDAAIVASNDLDEHLIQSLKLQDCRINVWGVGTNLVTGSDQPALGGVYKLAAIRNAAGEWDPRIKLSEQAIKVTTPGMQQIRRFVVDGEAVCDAIYDELNTPHGGWMIVDPLDITRYRPIAKSTPFEDLLKPVFRAGRRVDDPPPLATIRSRVRDQLALFHAGIKRFENPHAYPVGLEKGLHDLKTRLILQARDSERAGSPVAPKPGV